MYKVIRLFFASFLLCLLTFGVVPTVHADQNLQVKINNYSSKSLSFAFARENGYDASSTTTIGWYTVPARSTKSLKLFRYTPNDNYYWFVKVSGGKAITRANDFTGWVTPGKAFKSIDGRKPGGGVRVGFKNLNEKHGRCTINMGKK
ncbi:MAG: hypothetical protein K6G15_11945 [Desulfovibrio sp.]|nr:hypothetical protein [Desulfovibrio sp.]